MKTSIMLLVLVALSCVHHRPVPKEALPASLAKRRRSGNCLSPASKRPSQTASSTRVELDGVAFDVMAAWDDDYLAVHVSVAAVDGLCHGIVQELLRVETYRSHGQGGMRGRNARSPCIFPVVWLHGKKRVQFSWAFAREEVDKSLNELTVGFFEVESSTPGRTFSPDIARINISYETQPPQITVTPLHPPLKLEAGWYLGNRKNRCEP